jgi:nitric oxide reductase NorQ protein
MSGMDLKMCSKLVQLAQKIRAQKHLDLKETVSTRLLVHSARLAQAGLPLRKACFFGIAECLSDDSQVVEGLRDLIHLSL